jgi:hypothetical protein
VFVQAAITLKGGLDIFHLTALDIYVHYLQYFQPLVSQKL